MRTKRVTSRQVALKAGVSQTTVSFVLNDLASANNISDETTQRVLKAAEELGYVPNVAARSLARGRSANIGLILAQAQEVARAFEMDLQLWKLFIELRQFWNNKSQP